jgi:hypothetical protein
MSKTLYLYSLKKYIKCNIWRVAVRPSYIQNARFLKVNTYRVATCFPLHIHGSVTHMLEEGMDIFHKLLSLDKSIAFLPLWPTNSIKGSHTSPHLVEPLLPVDREGLWRPFHLTVWAIALTPFHWFPLSFKIFRTHSGMPNVENLSHHTWLRSHLVETENWTYELVVTI